MGKGFTSVVWPPFFTDEPFQVNAGFPSVRSTVSKKLLVTRVKADQIGAGVRTEVLAAGENAEGPFGVVAMGCAKTPQFARRDEVL